MAEWERIREAYITGNDGAAALARRFGVDRREIAGRMETEQWKLLRQQHRSERTAKAILRLDGTWEGRLRRVDTIADSLLTKLERAVEELDIVTVNCREKVKTEEGEQTRDYQRLMREEPGIIDRGGLKQLTAVLKDIKDVLMLRSEADIREQEARIAKLQRDLERRETEESKVIVTMEGECGEYAD